MNLRRDVFQAIADPTRRAILMLVATQSMTAGAIPRKLVEIDAFIEAGLDNPNEWLSEKAKAIGK